MAKEAQAPTKVPQPHGGALNSGGTPGNKGGHGATPKSIRNRCMGLLDAKGVKKAEEILDGDNPSLALTAVKTLADIALPKQHEQTITLNNAVVYDAWADCVGEKLGPVVLAELQALVKERLPENWQGD